MTIIDAGILSGSARIVWRNAKAASNERLTALRYREAVSRADVAVHLISRLSFDSTCQTQGPGGGTGCGPARYFMGPTKKSRVIIMFLVKWIYYLHLRRESQLYPFKG